MPKTTKTFDKAAYDLEYQRKHYKKLTGAFTKEEAARVETAARKAELTVSKYIKQAVLKQVEQDERTEEDPI